ncbi:MAG: carboxysome shell carbonic anhydrase [bacterium]
MLKRHHHKRRTSSLGSRVEYQLAPPAAFEAVPAKSATERTPAGSRRMAARAIVPNISATNMPSHALVNQAQNIALRAYETRIKANFDQVAEVVDNLVTNQHRDDFVRWAQRLTLDTLGFEWSNQQLLGKQGQGKLDRNALYATGIFEQFNALTQEFFNQDPLQGQQVAEAEQRFRDAGFHAVGIAPCADGRLAHIMSYVLRLPYAVARRKAHAGALFDVSESVRHWVFIEHMRYREGQPNPATEPTHYLKIAVYHFSASDPHHQGCAAHGSDDAKAAAAAQNKLNDFRQAIEGHFGCSSTLQTLLIGLNTDDDSLRIHAPNQRGRVCLKRFFDTKALYQQTQGLAANAALAAISTAIDDSNINAGSSAPTAAMRKLLTWFVENNFSQIAYVNEYENGCYSDIGHAERFIGIGNGLEEVQLRNLTYYGFLETIEEGAKDIDVGIKIFKGLNIKQGRPIPIIIHHDYDGRVPGSKARAEQKARRIETALHERYAELSQNGWLFSLCTLRDYRGFKPTELLKPRMEQE